MKNKHPRGLLFLFFTEMWERFGYYLIIGIFVLYMIDPTATGGLAFSDKYADDIFAVILLVGMIGVFYLARNAKHQNSNDKFFALLKTTLKKSTKHLSHKHSFLSI